MKFLIDINLPFYISIWNSDDFIHQKDIDDESTDTEIWNYAKEKKLTILTKDTDFSDRILAAKPPPKVIHFKTGNMKIKDFRNFLIEDDKWNRILSISKDYKLTIVFKDRIEAHS